MKLDDPHDKQTGPQSDAAGDEAPTRGLGQRIRKQRKALGLTLNQLSEKSGVSIATISKIENGLINGGFDTIYKVARGLGVLVNDLIGKSAGQHEAMVVLQAAPEPQHPTEYYDYYPQAMRVGGALNPYLMTIKTREVPPRVDWSNHEGEEFIHVIAGAIDLYHEDGPARRLDQGDSACFDSGPAHCFVCASAEPAVIVTVSTRGIAANSPRAQAENPARPGRA